MAVADLGGPKWPTTKNSPRNYRFRYFLKKIQHHFALDEINFFKYFVLARKLVVGHFRVWL